MSTARMSMALADGGKEKLLGRIGREAAGFDVVQKVVWEGKPTVFGFKV